MKEREFQTGLVKGARFRGFHTVPIPDSGNQRFTTPKVYDLGLGKNRLYFPCELKQTYDNTFKISKMEPHQIENLLNGAENGFISLVICLWEKFEYTGRLSSKGKKVRKFTGRIALAVEIKPLLAAFDFFGLGYLSFKWWMENGFELPEFKVPGFDRKGRPAFTKSKKRRMDQAWDFEPVYEALRGKYNAIQHEGMVAI